jgi:hypothetical protein
VVSFNAAEFAVRSLIAAASRIAALSLVVTNVRVANAQSGLPRLEPNVARNLFDVYASCTAYWKVMAQCLPPGLNQEHLARLRRSFDQLQSAGVEQSKWLGAKAQLSQGMQQRIIERASSRITAGIGSKCENGPALEQEYRGKCAALFENIAAAQKEGPSADRQTEAEATQSAADFIISNCYEPIDDVSRVSSYARMMKWKALSADEKNLMKPVETTDFEGWQVDHDGDMYVISINHGRVNGGRFNGRPNEVCQVMVPQRAGPVIAKITEKIRTRLVGTKNVGDQVSEAYELIDHPSINPATMLVNRPLDDRSFFVIAFMGIKSMPGDAGRAQESNAVGLTGAARKSFVESTTNGCLKEQARRQLPFPSAAISQYCVCYANAVADRLSVDELKRQQAMSLKEQDVAMDPIVASAGRQCASALGLRGR